MSALSKRLEATLAGTPFERDAARTAEILGERADIAATLAEAADPVFRGMALATASRPEAARYLSHRSELASRLARLEPAWVATRIAEFDADAEAGAPDLQDFLDEIRLLHRDERLLAAALDLGGLVPFEAISTLLSTLAEAIVRRALRRAEESPPPAPPLAVVAMGKLGGREFTYHSDLDLVFLHGGGDEAEALHAASRVAQRFIQYLATMTGAGIAYTVDSRLRPSGGQGTLVASYPGFEHYQRREAAPWEHLALVRARAIAGPVKEASATLETIRAEVLGKGRPWPEIERMRGRVEAERADESKGIELKTGPGGLMDAEFLAQGAAVECGSAELAGEVPSIPQLLRALVPNAEAIVSAYGFLRRVESRVRWVSGRPVERLERDREKLPRVAELVAPALAPEALLARTEDARRTLRAGFRSVCDAGGVAALAG